jgi:hypothetical protein
MAIAAAITITAAMIITNDAHISFTLDRSTIQGVVDLEFHHRVVAHDYQILNFFKSSINTIMLGPMGMQVICESVENLTICGHHFHAKSRHCTIEISERNAIISSHLCHIRARGSGRTITSQ